MCSPPAACLTDWLQATPEAPAQLLTWGLHCGAGAGEVGLAVALGASIPLRVQVSCCCCCCANRLLLCMQCTWCYVEPQV